ncbi:MAG: hypothetical protein Q8J61_01790, partial [Sulfuricella sp.]|nr:hypothetical protein [Sulfuricella sp.]
LSTLPAPHRERGGALLIILTIIGIGAAWLLVSALNSNPQIERDKTTADALAKAKDALIGYAVTYRDTHADNVFGYLPCPDVNNDGVADAIQGGTGCANKDIPVAGRLPWKTLGLPPLRDSHGECLWYAVSGTFKAVAGGNLTDFMNWDTLGQFTVQDAGGSTVSGTTAHSRPVAVIFSPGPPLSTQNHPASSGQECSGDTSNSVAAYLDGGNVFAIPSPPPVMLTAGAYGNTTVNDRLLWISPTEIFDRIKRRSDFAADVNDLLSNTPISPGGSITLASYLNSLAPANLPTLTSGTKGSADVYNKCKTADPTNCWNKLTARQQNFLANWYDNLLYTKLATPTKITVNGALTANACNAVLIFGGERTTRTVAPLVAQTRATPNEKNDAAMYLEGANATSFPSGTSFSGAAAYAPASPSTDVLACIGVSTPPPIVGGTPITLNATTITAACSGVCGSSGIDTGVTTLALAGTPALTITATGGTIGRNQGGESTDAIGVYQGSGGAGNTALQAGESLSFRLTGNTAQKFGITLYDFSAGEQALLTFKNNGTIVGTYTATTATTANINPGGAFDEVVVQAVGASDFWVQTVKFCDAATSC